MYGINRLVPQNFGPQIPPPNYGYQNQTQNLTVNRPNQQQNKGYDGVYSGGDYSFNELPVQMSPYMGPMQYEFEPNGVNVNQSYNYQNRSMYLPQDNNFPRGRQDVHSSGNRFDTSWLFRF